MCNFLYCKDICLVKLHIVKITYPLTIITHQLSQYKTKNENNLEYRL